MAVTRILLMLLLAAGCASAPLEKRSPECEESCRAALDLRDKTMKKFERLCIALTYVGARHFDDKNIQQEVREGVMVCDYVYGNKNHG